MKEFHKDKAAISIIITTNGLLRAIDSDGKIVASCTVPKNTWFMITDDGIYLDSRTEDDNNQRLYRP